MEKERLISRCQRIPKRPELRLVDIFSRNICRHHDAVHMQVFVAPLQFPHAIVHVDHRQARKRHEALWMFRVRLGEGVVEDAAKFHGARPVAGFFDPSAGVGKHADIDAVFVHDIEVLAMIEGVEADAAHIVLRLRNQVQKFAGKGVEVSIDDHGCSLFKFSPRFTMMRRLRFTTPSVFHMSTPITRQVTIAVPC